MKTIRRDAKGRGQVDALVWADVERVCAFAEADKSVAGYRDSAMIRLMSDCLLRVSEVVAVNVWHFKQNTLIVQRSKTDQQGKGVALYVTSDTRNAISKFGSAVSLAKAGASVVDLQVAGRWKNSQMPAHYARAETAERGTIARFKETDHS